LLEDIDTLQTAARDAAHGTLRQLANHWQSMRPAGDAHALGVGLVAGDVEHLQALLIRARAAVSQGEPCLEDSVYYTPSPQGLDGEVAFVFPGSGNQYAEMGRELALDFPGVIDALERENAHLASQFAGGRIWDDDALATLTPRDAILAHVWFGALASDVLGSFQVRPDAVIGYSLGESSGLIATRAWRERDVMLHRLRNSTLFTDQLAGDCKAARKAWGLAAGQEVNWRVGIVDRPAEVVRRALEGRRWVYLLIVNTPDECVVGGHRNAVDDLVRTLGCHCHPLEAITTVHCEVAEPVAERYRELHLLPTRSPEGIRFYSSAWASAYEVTRETAADSILAQALAPFEFPRLIERAYGDGVRVFVEIGPGRSCTRMIDRILEDKPHAALAVFPGARDERGALLRALARLAAERVPLSLAPLSVPELTRDETAASGRLAMPLEAPRFVVPPPTGAATAEVLSMPERPQRAVATKPAAAANLGGASMGEALVRQAAHTESARAAAQAAFLKLARHQSEMLARAVDMQVRLAAGSPHAAARILEPAPPTPTASAPLPSAEPQSRAALDRPACLEFAVGSIATVLGERFAPVDALPTRVRLPDEPLMLVDLILEVDAEAQSMSHGRVVTEHDVLPGAWYLDGGRIPTCIAVEAGQADLFLCGYLGIDFETRGLAVYRLLDARVTFHGPLPAPGKTIRYDIRIDGFFEQGDTRLFRFNFDASVEGKPLLTMRDGCAGFGHRAEHPRRTDPAKRESNARQPGTDAQRPLRRRQAALVARRRPRGMLRKHVHKPAADAPRGIAGRTHEAGGPHYRSGSRGRALRSRRHYRRSGHPCGRLVPDVSLCRRPGDARHPHV
jgi:acyl transferase domain-containing protein